MLKPRSVDEETATKVNLLSLVYNYSKTKLEKSSLLDFSEKRKIIRELKKDNNLIVTKPEKGNGCVLMNKSEYLEKINDIISDSTKFKLLGKAKELDNIDKVESETIKFLKQLLFKNGIIESLFNLIKPVGSVTPRLYGLPKINKKNIPLMPILSMVNSAQRKLAKFLNSSLEPVLKYFSAYCLKDSFTFVDKIKEMEAQNTFIASFDVKSLFTNVPLEEVIEICVDTLHKISKLTVSRMN